MIYAASLTFWAAFMAIAGLVAAIWAFLAPEVGGLKQRARATWLILSITGLWVVVLAGGQWLLSWGAGDDRAHAIRLVEPGMRIVGANDLGADSKSELTEAQVEYADERERRAWAACERAVLEDERPIAWWQDDREVIRTWLTQCLESRGYTVVEPDEREPW
jgi:hypothetical protein